MTKKPAIKLAQEAKIAMGKRTRETVVDILRKSKQPLVAKEVQALLIERGLNFDVTYVGSLLSKLAADKTISSRNETEKERMVRRGTDGRGAHFTAIYYWAPVGKVPARTAEMLPQTDGLSRNGNKKKTKRNRPARVVSMQTGASAETMMMLLNRITQLEAELARLKK